MVGWCTIPPLNKLASALPWPFRLFWNLPTFRSGRAVYSGLRPCTGAQSHWFNGAPSHQYALSPTAQGVRRPLPSVALRDRRPRERLGSVASRDQLLLQLFQPPPALLGVNRQKL